MNSSTPITATTAPAALSLDGLGKSFGTREVLRDVTLNVDAGSVVAVLGPSGEGKTTLLRLIAGFEHPDHGAISIEGTLVADSVGGRRSGAWVPPERRRVGMVPQEGALFPHLTVGENIGFGLPKQGRAERVEQMLALVGLRGSESRRPHELSGGQQHRVALARALAPQPALIVLDEPFSSLDTGLRAEVRGEVMAAVRAAGATAVLVTHDQEEALSVADTVVVLLGRTVAQVGTPEDVYQRPASLGVVRFLGQANLIQATLVSPTTAVWNGEQLSVEFSGTVPRLGSALWVLARHGDIEFEAGDFGTGWRTSGGVGHRASVGATARRTEYRGGLWNVVAELDDGSSVVARSNVAHPPGTVGAIVVRPATLAAFAA